MTDDTSLPVDRQFLDMYRLEARQLGRMLGSGAHLTPHSGQSLEFREHAAFTLGDDVRFIDRMASQRAQARGRRTGLPWEHWIVRRFQAEQHFRTVISIDSTETMLFPRDTTVTVSKFQVACWIAEATAYICLELGDRVSAHSLFGSAAPLPTIRRDDIAGQIHKATPAVKETILNSAPLRDLLPPAAIWLIVTDLYAPRDVLTQLAEEMRAAKAGGRQVVLIELDSWPYERLLLGRGNRRVDGPQTESKYLHIGPKDLDGIEEELAERRRLFQAFRAVRWIWPEMFDSRDAVKRFFRAQFTEGQARSALASIFIRD